MAPSQSAERREEKPRERDRDQGQLGEPAPQRDGYQDRNDEVGSGSERHRSRRHHHGRGRDREQGPDEERGSDQSRGRYQDQGRYQDHSRSEDSGRTQDQGRSQTPLPASPSSQDGTSRDLSRDEAAGGHILRKHVGQSDDDLRQRMQRETRITGASTYTDRPTAERAVGAAIAQSHDKIERWMSGGSHQNLVLDYDSPNPVGRTMNRGENEARPCGHAKVILKYSGANNYYVLTSYPECR